MKLPKTIEEVEEFLKPRENLKGGFTLDEYDVLACFKVYTAKHKKKSKWIEWSGGDYPVSADTLIKVQFRNLEKTERGCPPRIWNWEHKSQPFDIIAYKIVEEK